MPFRLMITKRLIVGFQSDHQSEDDRQINYRSMQQPARQCFGTGLRKFGRMVKQECSRRQHSDGVGGASAVNDRQCSRNYKSNGEADNLSASKAGIGVEGPASRQKHSSTSRRQRSLSTAGAGNRAIKTPPATRAWAKGTAYPASASRNHETAG